jgi:hypothetical protein
MKKYGFKITDAIEKFQPKPWKWFSMEEKKNLLQTPKIWVLFRDYKKLILKEFHIL